jgi:hypothetical protein
VDVSKVILGATFAIIAVSLSLDPPRGWGCDGGSGKAKCPLSWDDGSC